MPDADAVVVALKSRTAPVAAGGRREPRGARLAAARRLPRSSSSNTARPSTAPIEGNIGPVADALVAALGCGFALANPAFPANARSVYQGHLFVGGALLNESGMENHPLTPMTRRQPGARAGAADRRHGRAGALRRRSSRAPARSARAMTALKEQGRRYAIVDAVSDAHLIAIGDAAAERHALITGGSGIAMGLPENFRRAGLLPDAATPAALPRGRRAMRRCWPVRARARRWARSATRATMCRRWNSIRWPRRTPRHSSAQALAWAEGKLGDAPVVIAASAPPDKVAALQAAAWARRAPARWSSTRSPRIAEGLVARGVRRLVVAGGETSGAVVSRLGVRSLRIGAEIDPGVPWTYAEGGAAPLLLALKSGNFGAPRLLPEGLRGAGRRRMTEDETRGICWCELAREPVRARLFRRQRRQYQRAPGRRLPDHADQLLRSAGSTRRGCRKLDARFRHVSGDKPSKEVFMHRAF